MFKLFLHVLVASLTFSISVITAKLLALYQRPATEKVEHRRWYPRHVNSLCPDGLVVVAAQPDSPVSISPVSCDSRTPNAARVQFTVVNVSAKPISKFKVAARLGYKEYKQGRWDGMSVEHQYPADAFLLPGWSDQSALGGGVLTRSGGIPVGALQHFTLFVESVTFADGTKWASFP